MQDVTLQVLHHQEKISMADFRWRGMSVFPASVQREVLQELTLSYVVHTTRFYQYFFCLVCLK